MEQVNLIIRIQGQDIHKGIDVFEFAPSIMALGNLVQESAKTVRLTKQLGINIKPIERGSFLIELGLFTKHNINELFSLIKNNDIQSIKELLEWLGIISGSSVGLFKFIQWMVANPKAQRENLEGGKVKYIQENNSIIIEGNVDKLYYNPTVQENIYHIFIPLQNEKVNNYDIYLKGNEDHKNSYYREDLEYFKKYSEQDLQPEEEGIESIYDTTLNFKRGSFEGESNQWSFRKADQIIVAVIKDEAFLSRIRSTEIRPTAKDYLRVTIKESPKMSGTIVKSVVYEILKVLDYKAYEPSHLF